MNCRHPGNGLDIDDLSTNRTRGLFLRKVEPERTLPFAVSEQITGRGQDSSKINRKQILLLVFS